jgi:hypothetical protein
LFIGLAPFQLERNARVPLAAEPLPLMIPFLADHRAMDFTVSKICGNATKNSSHLSTVIFTTKGFVNAEVLHGDFLSEIKYLFNLVGNSLHILTRNVIFFYDFSN